MTDVPADLAEAGQAPFGQDADFLCGEDGEPLEFGNGEFVDVTAPFPTRNDQ